MGRRSASETTPKALIAATVRSVARALEGSFAEIQGGAAFSITRLTRVKRLCADQAAGQAFAAFIARQALAKLERRTRSDTVTSDFVKRYEPGAFGDLNRASAEPLAELLAGLDREQLVGLLLGLAERDAALADKVDALERSRR